MPQIPFGGSQPWGCSTLVLSSNLAGVFITTYFEPSIMRLNVELIRDGELRLTVDAIRSADHGLDSVRLWPGVPGGPFGMENRGREVSAMVDNTLWINRSDRHLFALSESKQNGRRSLVRKITLPDPWNDQRWVHSMCVLDTEGKLRIRTIEGVGNAINVTPHLYAVRSDDSVEELEADFRLPGSDWIYGWGKASGSDTPWFVTDARCTSVKHGIYHGEHLVLEDTGDKSLTGTGIDFLPDGTAVITQYGQGFPGPFNGREGRLIIVPADLL